MSEVGGVAGDRLRSFIERIERLEEERATIAVDIREVYAEAKANGFDPQDHAAGRKAPEDGIGGPSRTRGHVGNLQRGFRHGSARGATAGRRVTLYLQRTGGFRDEPERIWSMNAEMTAGLSIVNSLRGRLCNRLFATIVCSVP